MLGWVNISIANFICDTFGVEKWEEVLAASGVTQNWASSCPYSDKITYDLVVTAAGILGVSVNDALEAYGLYFVQHVEDQGYTRLLNVLGSNLAEFLQNLNDLHLHLQYCWPAMVAPGFRCEEVTPESLLLHYFSNRPGLWPIVVGVLKGMSNDYFKLDLKVELVHSREKGDCDHEVLKLTYPYQPALRDWGRETEAAQCSFFSMPAPLFYELHSFHLIMDSKMHLLQWGAAVGRVEPGLEVGKHVRDVFRCKQPSYIQLEYDQILVNTNSSFVLQSRSSGITLKGQMLPTTVQQPGAPAGSPPSPVLVFLASPWMRSLSDMQATGVFLSDIPRYDLCSDYILLAEQRQAEADLKDKYERLTLELQAANDKLARTTAFLEEEKARAEALLYRMSGLIACFPAGPGAAADGKQLRNQRPQTQPSSQSVLSLLESTVASQTMQHSTMQSATPSADKQSTALDRIEAVRRELARNNISSPDSATIQCMELLGEGTYGKVYKGLWKGSVVAVKTIVLPAVMSGQEKREKMAIMEAAISSALSHPNIMQTYTYDIKPIKDTSRPEQKLVLLGSTASTGGHDTGSSATTESTDNIHSYEVRLVCEYCDKGSLREALDLGAFKRADGSVNYPAVLDTAIEIATAVAHLHHRNVLHSDLKARNIMLKSTGGSGRGVTAKVADFGLAVKMDHMETHLSNAFQGTLTHMAPEILIKGHISKAADVYAFGMVLWELYTSQKVFKGIPRALLGHQITQLNRRPEFPRDAPEDYVKLTQACWDPSASKRPTLEFLLERLQALRAGLRSTTDPLTPYDIESMIVRKASVSASRAHPKSPAGNGAVQFGAGGQRTSSGAAAAAAAAGAVSPGVQGGAFSRSTHMGRMAQQQQRHHPAARRTVSTPLIQPGCRSPQQPELRTAISAGMQSLGASPASLAAAAASASRVEDSDELLLAQQYAAAGMSTSFPGPAGASMGAASHHMQQQSGESFAECDEGDSGASGSGSRSFYLEHSDSTADGQYANWRGPSNSGQEVSFGQPGLLLDPAGRGISQGLVSPLQQGPGGGPQQQQQQQGAAGGFSFASDASGAGAVSSCPYAAAATRSREGT